MSAHVAKSAEPYHKLKLADLGYSGPHIAGVKGMGTAIVFIKFSDGAFCLRAMRYRDTAGGPTGFDDLDIDPSSGKIRSITKIPASSARVSNQWTPAVGAAMSKQDNRQQSQYHPTTLDQSTLTEDAEGFLYISVNGGVRHQIFTPHCSANDRAHYPPAQLAAFFLDSQHIYVSDCGHSLVISPGGERLFKTDTFFPPGPVAVTAATVATLKPSSAFPGALIPGPEDSATLKVFGLATGKELLRAHWPAGDWNLLAASSDGRYVARAGVMSVRFYRVETPSCSSSNGKAGS